MFRKFSPGFSRAVNRLLRSLPGIRHTTATAADPDAATTMEKLELNRSGAPDFDWTRFLDANRAERSASVHRPFGL